MSRAPGPRERSPWRLASPTASAGRPIRAIGPAAVGAAIRVPALMAMAWLLAGLPLLLSVTSRHAHAGDLAAASIMLVTSGCAGSPVRGLLAARGRSRAGADTLVDHRCSHCGGGRVRRRPADYHSQLIIVSVTRLPTSSSATGSRRRIAAHPAERRGVRRHAIAHLRQLRLLPGRPRHRAPVHGRAADDSSRSHSGSAAPGAALRFGAVLGRMRVLTFGGLVGRLVGPRWAPLGR